ncbi:hypothetical protein [Paenibacillus sp. UNC451MF]|uniref:hypothetical protein n=1 Tax=Paenibacillus sp. UNC451MF TaxID=1449063 RepID=UPI00048CD4BE|nr:hypothetical protein [Paenibacillus sp. UNC451MF]
MNKFNSYEDAERLAIDGIASIMAGALVSAEAQQLLQAHDLIKNQARIRIFADDGRSHSDHFVMECESSHLGLYLLCISIGNGTSIMNYSADEILSFREECESNDIAIQRGVPVLCYSYRGIALVSQEIVDEAF